MRKDINKKRLLKKANRSFLKRDLKRAIFYYSLVLNQDPKNQEARVGVLLSSIAMDGNEEAFSIFEYYQLLKEEKNRDALKIVEELINSAENRDNILTKIFEEVALDLDEGISYEDFKKLVESRGSFKVAFEDIMFSTKVYISNKNDFFDFLENLIENGFEDIALTYLEDISTLYPADTKIFELFKKIDFKNDS